MVFSLICFLSSFFLICVVRLIGVFFRERKKKKGKTLFARLLSVSISVGSILLLRLDSSKDIWKGFVNFQLGK